MSEDTTTTEAAEGSASVEADAASDATTSPEASTTRSARKVREGMVTSAGMDKTIVVTVTDRVRVMETRPMSKSKRWRLVEVIERAR